MNYAPMVIEQIAGGGERAIDIYSRLLKDRIIFLGTDFNDSMAATIVAQMLFLEHDQPETPINIYINSPGGAVTAALGILSVMNYITSPVYTTAIGYAASAGSLILQAGEPGFRHVFPDTEVMIHRVSSGFRGASGTVQSQEEAMIDAQRTLEETKKMNRRLTQIYVENNTKGKTFDEMFETLKYDTYFNGQEAIDFGLADVLLTKKHKV